MNPASPPAVTMPTPTHLHDLPSGRTVHLLADAVTEQLQIRSPQGQVEVEIVLTPAGPVVRVHGGKLEFATPQDVSIRCRSFAVETEAAVTIRGQEMRVKTDAAIYLNGETVRLNCPEDGSLPSASAVSLLTSRTAVLPTSTAALPTAAAPPASPPTAMPMCGCGNDTRLPHDSSAATTN